MPAGFQCGQFPPTAGRFGSLPPHIAAVSDARVSTATYWFLLPTYLIIPSVLPLTFTQVSHHYLARLLPPAVHIYYGSRFCWALPAAVLPSPQCNLITAEQRHCLYYHGLTFTHTLPPAALPTNAIPNVCRAVLNALLTPPPNTASPGFCARAKLPLILRQNFTTVWFLRVCAPNTGRFHHHLLPQFCAHHRLRFHGSRFLPATVAWRAPFTTTTYATALPYAVPCT